MSESERRCRARPSAAFADPGVGPIIAANLYRIGIHAWADLRGRSPERALRGSLPL